MHLIHGIDSEKLLLETNKQAQKLHRQICCLLQVHIATEETKFGFDDAGIKALIHHMQKDPSSFSGVMVQGLMGMASFTENTVQVQQEFEHLHQLFNSLQQNDHVHMHLLSMGMSADYELAVAHGSNMVRIGSLLFGERNK